ncbi:Major facilitator superfamily domain-containing protein 1 [Balamuthia mandrillaris]
MNFNDFEPFIDEEEANGETPLLSPSSRQRRQARSVSNVNHNRGMTASTSDDDDDDAAAPLLGSSTPLQASRAPQQQQQETGYSTNGELYSRSVDGDSYLPPLSSAASSATATTPTALMRSFGAAKPQQRKQAANTLLRRGRSKSQPLLSRQARQEMEQERRVIQHKTARLQQRAAKQQQHHATMHSVIRSRHGYEEPILGVKRAEPLMKKGKKQGFEPRYGFFHPERAFFRYIILLFACLTEFGHMFAFDSPSALVTSLKTELEISDLQYLAFFSVYNWPNCVMVFFGGYLVDRLGRLKAVLIFCSIVFLGQCMFALGGSLGNYWVMLIGRFIFGAGSESMFVATMLFIAYWFRGKNMVLALSICVSNESLGGTVNFLVSPWLASQFNLPISLWFGAMICAGSLVAAVILVIIDYRGTKTMDPIIEARASALQRRLEARKRKLDKIEAAQKLIEAEAEEEDEEEAEDENKTNEQKKAAAEEEEQTNEDAEAEEEEEEGAEEKVEEDEEEEEEEEEESEQIRLRDITKFSFSYWLWVGITCFFYAFAYPFFAIVSDMLQDQWGYSERAAGKISSIYFALAGLLSPFFGLFLDKVGGNGIAVMIGTTGTVLMLVVLTFVRLPIVPIGPIMVMGVLYCCAPAITSCIPRLVEMKVLGTAYGIAFASMNLFAASLTLAIGKIKGHYGWLPPSLIFISMAAVASVLAIWVNLINGCCYGKINWSSKHLRQERIEHKVRRMASQMGLSLDSAENEKFLQNLAELMSGERRETEGEADGFASASSSFTEKSMLLAQKEGSFIVEGGEDSIRMDVTSSFVNNNNASNVTRRIAGGGFQSSNVLNLDMEEEAEGHADAIRQYTDGEGGEEDFYVRVSSSAPSASFYSGSSDSYDDSVEEDHY